MPVDQSFDLRTTYLHGPMLQLVILVQCTASWLSGVVLLHHSMDAWVSTYYTDCPRLTSTPSNIMPAGLSLLHICKDIFNSIIRDSESRRLAAAKTPFHSLREKPVGRLCGYLGKKRRYQACCLCIVNVYLASLAAPCDCDSCIHADTRIKCNRQSRLASSASIHEHMPALSNLSAKDADTLICTATSKAPIPRGARHSYQQMNVVV